MRSLLTSHRRIARASATLAIVLVAAPAVDAQSSRADRPSRGLFGGGSGDPEQALVLTAAFGMGYADNPLLRGEPMFPATSSPSVAASGGFGQLSAELDYRLKRPRLNVNADTAAYLSRYASFGDRTIGMYDASVAAGLALTRRTQLLLTQNGSLHPYYTFSLVPATVSSGSGVAESQVSGAVPDRLETFSTSSGIELIRSIADRDRASVAYSYRYSNAPDDRFNVRMHSGVARLEHPMGRSGNWNIGYSHQQGFTGSSGSRQQTTLDGVRGGFGYRWPVSSTRHAAFTAGAGTTYARSGGNRRLVVVGNASFDRDLGRSWKGRVAYDRSVDMVEGIREPATYDSLVAGVSGFANRRVGLRATASAAVGHVGVSSGGHAFQIYRGDGGATFAVSRQVAIAVDYSYYRYMFPANAVLPSDVSRRMSRHAVGVQVVTRLPLYERGQRGRNASR